MKKRRGKFEPGGYRLRVRRSRAGLGLFTEEAIPKGRCVIEYVGVPISEEAAETSRSKYLFEIDSKTTIDGAPRWNTARYINHSCRPNAEIEIRKKRIYVMAKRAIKAGEELSYDYGKEYFDDYIKPHGCRCPKCRP